MSTALCRASICLLRRPISQGPVGHSGVTDILGALLLLDTPLNEITPRQFSLLQWGGCARSALRDTVLFGAVLYWIL